MFRGRWRAFLLAMLLPLAALCQKAHPALRSLSAIAQPEGVMLRWVIEGGNTCNGTNIQRSADRLRYDHVGNLPGICGSTSRDEAYEYLDKNPIRNKTTYYRLELGDLGLSEPVSVMFADFGTKGYALLTDPSGKGWRIIHADSPLSQPASLELMDALGTVRHTASSRHPHFDIEGHLLRPGAYLFRISAEGKRPIIGRLIVQ